jgi:hypothetical protein
MAWYPNSQKSDAYNCIAFALGFENVLLWPDPNFDMDWPRPKPDVVTVQEFTDVFALFGYEPSTSIFEAGYEKIALYVSQNDSPEHAARMRPSDGRWLAKLGGAGIDVLQDFLSDFPQDPPYYGCRSYGGAKYFYKRNANSRHPKYEEVAAMFPRRSQSPQLYY